MFYLTNQNVIDFELKKVDRYFVCESTKMYLILSADAEGYYCKEVNEHGRAED